MTGGEDITLAGVDMSVSGDGTSAKVADDMKAASGGPVNNGIQASGDSTITVGPGVVMGQGNTVQRG
ncbi:hypothetical protein SMD44_00949 [Streptomyces alboflavus]|uniref:Uncharacterized protein n=1 Tax=Streptomyces alboflavus TaxID=67267 RepID=A0A1Z1W555_9ACTN|nr:hypothetical protein SMD44_00949 [Streptomyces alboflavus]